VWHLTEEQVASGSNSGIFFPFIFCLFRRSRGCKHMLLADCQCFKSLQFIISSSSPILLHCKAINNNNNIAVGQSRGSELVDKD